MHTVECALRLQIPTVKFRFLMTCFSDVGEKPDFRLPRELKAGFIKRALFEFVLMAD